MRYLLTALSLVLTGCGYYHEVKTQPEGPGLLGDNSTLGFESVKAIVFNPYCIACHSQSGGNRGGVNLESYARTLPVVAMIRSSVSSGRMPMGATLPNREKTVLMAWLDAGAPETSALPIPGAPVVSPTPNPTPNPIPTPAGPDFATVKAQIFQPHCVGCHGGFGNYATVKANLTGIESMVMSNRMPKGAPLSTALKNLLSEWIKAGAPDSAANTNPNPNPGPGPNPGPCPTKHGHDDDPCQQQDDDDFQAPKRRQT